MSAEKRPWTEGTWYTYDKGVNEIACCGGKIDCIEISSEGGESASWIAQVMTRHNPSKTEQGIANARLMSAAPALYEALAAMLAEKEDYMRINHLGDPANETTNKMARAALSAALHK